MKKLVMMTAMAALLVAIFATAAFSITDGTCSSYPCSGNNSNNVLDERRGDGTTDKIYGRGGSDVLNAWQHHRDRDVLFGNHGRDHIAVTDNDNLDLAVGGPGPADLCRVDSRQEVGPGCNEVWVEN